MDEPIHSPDNVEQSVRKGTIHDKIFVIYKFYGSKRNA